MTNGNKMAEWRLYIEDIKVWSWTQGRSFMTNLFNKSCLDIHLLIFSKLPKWLMSHKIDGSDFVHLELTLELLGILKGSTMAKFLILIARDFTQNWRHWLKMNGKQVLFNKVKLVRVGECRGEDEIYHCVTSVVEGTSNWRHKHHQTLLSTNSNITNSNMPRLQLFKNIIPSIF